MIQHNCALVNLRFRKGDGDRGPKMPGDLVQRGRKNKGLRGFVHQVRGGRTLKISEDLVQVGRKNKVLRGFVHQVRGDRGPKMSEDLVQRGRKNKGLRGFVHQVRGGRGPGTPRARHTAGPPPGPIQKKAIKNGTMVRQVHRSGALNWYAMWGRVRISSVLSERSVLQPFC